MVSGTFIIGDDLAFTASVNKEMILPVIVGKGVAGIAAVAVAWFATKKLEEKANPRNKDHQAEKNAA